MYNQSNPFPSKKERQMKEGKRGRGRGKEQKRERRKGKKQKKEERKGIIISFNTILQRKCIHVDYF